MGDLFFFLLTYNYFTYTKITMALIYLEKQNDDEKIWKLLKLRKL